MRQLPGQEKNSISRAISAYVLVGGLWIVASNHVLAATVNEPRILSVLTTLFNIGFVAVTGGIMYRSSLHARQEGVRRVSQDLAQLEQERDHLREKIAQQSEELFHLQGILQHKSSGTNPNSGQVAEFTGASSQLLAQQPDSTLIQGIQWAIAHHEFVLHYQPIVTLNTSRIIGFEALIRWQPPQRDLIMPGEFIPAAEATDLIVPVGEWVLEEACRQAEAWRQQFPQLSSLLISVNLSSKQFNQPDLVNQIAAVLEKTALPPSCLKLEITESAIMENAESAIAMLTKLHQMGVKLSIDDFGTGYSSLSYLYYFPVDSLKVDRSFISRIDKDGEQVELVRTVLTLAWNLGLSTIAEGIETQTQLAQLKALHCEYGQGYFFSKPLPHEAARALLQDQVDNG